MGRVNCFCGMSTDRGSWLALDSMRVRRFILCAVYTLAVVFLPTFHHVVESFAQFCLAECVSCVDDDGGPDDDPGPSNHDFESCLTCKLYLMQYHAVGVPVQAALRLACVSVDAEYEARHQVPPLRRYRSRAPPEIRCS